MKKVLSTMLAGWLLLCGIKANAQEVDPPSGHTDRVGNSTVRAQDADPTAILMLAKQASGGSAWDTIRSLHLHAQSTAGGLVGVRDEWDDVRTGRYAVTFSRPPSAGADGFDGVSVWTSWIQVSSGYSYVLGDEDARLGAVNAAYQTCRAFWFPERKNATLALTGVQHEDGRAYDVIGITPQAGRPFNVWVDQETHLIDRFVEQQGEAIQITRLLDYRTVAEGIKLPSTIRVGDGTPKWDEVDTLQTVEINAPLAPDQFALPPNSAPDFQFQNGKTSTTIPFRLVDGKLLVDIKLNGQGPFEAELDSGGNYLMQPALARRLGLKPQGALQSGGGGENFVAAGKAIVDTVDLGDVRLTQQSYKVVERSKRAPESIIIGLQIFLRFVVSIDFDRQTLTLTQPDQFVYHGLGQVVPFHFQDNQPEVKGVVDGIAGVFAIDTGDDSSLLLIAPFVRQYDLVDHYKATIPYTGSAMGGTTYGLFARAGTLALCGADGRPAVEVRDPLTRLSQQKGGFDANRYVSGNVGIGILSQFNLTFDYHRQQIIFEKNSNYGKKEAYNRTGLRVKPEGLQWEVIGVIPDSPASGLGLKAGDRIVTIDGKNATQLGGDDLYVLFRQEVGTKIIFTIQSGADLRTVTVSLRDVL